MMYDNDVVVNESLTEEHIRQIENGDIVCSYNGVRISKERRSGTSTRIIDNCVQLLFDGKKVVVKNMPDSKKLKEAELLSDKIIRRMCIEHDLKEDDFEKEIVGHYYMLSLKK